MKKIALAIVTSTAVFVGGASAHTPTGAQIGSGFYLGGAFGASTTQVKAKSHITNQVPAVTANAKSTFGHFSGLLGAYTGYGFVNCASYYFGAELGVFFEDSKTKLSSSAFTINGAAQTARLSMKRDVFGTLAARIGYLPAKNVMFYARVGAEYDHSKVTASVRNFLGTTGVAVRVSKKEGHIIPAVGAGIEVALTNSIALRGEWVYQFNKKITTRTRATNRPFSVTASARPHHQRATLGISYKF